MKQTVLKALCLALALCTLASVFLIACGGTTTKTTETESKTSTDTVTETATETETENETVDIGKIFNYLEDDLGDLKFGTEGTPADITILYRGSPRYCPEIYKATFDFSDKIDSAVFKRNDEVSKRLNVTFHYEPDIGQSHSEDINNKVTTSVSSGDDTYQIVTNSNYWTCSFLTNGYYTNLAALPNLDLTKDYWAHFVNDNAKINGVIFTITGSISLVMYQSIFVTYVNRNLCSDFGIDMKELYQAVLHKRWTLDYVINKTQDIYVDTNGNNTKDYGDTYGYALQVTSVPDGFWSACDIRMTSLQEVNGKKNVPQLDVDISKLDKVIRKLNRFAWNHDGVLKMVEDSDFENAAKGLYAGVGSVVVSTDLALFSNDRLYEVCNDSMKACDHYGILPYPKYDDAQTQYYSYMHDTYSVFMVTRTTKNKPLAGAVLEALCVASHNDVLPVYYEEVLTTRYVTDPDNVAVLDIICQNIKMDTAWVFDIGGLPQELLRTQVWDNRTGAVTSVYKTSMRSCNGKLVAMYNKFTELAASAK